MLSKICWMYFCQFNVHTFPFIITLVSTLFMLYVSESLSYVIVFHFSLSAFSITWACHLPETSLFPTFRHSLGGTPPLPPIWSKVNVAYSAHNSPNITTCRDPYPSWWLFFLARVFFLIIILHTAEFEFRLCSSSTVFLDAGMFPWCDLSQLWRCLMFHNGANLLDLWWYPRSSSLILRKTGYSVGW